MFEDMRDRIRENTAKVVIKARCKKNIQKIEQPKAPTIIQNALPADPASKTVRRTQKKVGRNELCPCGSGKKYKDCCGKDE